MNRAEHLQWCKDRAIEYVNAGDLKNAFTSMVSDIMKHPETEHHNTTNQLGMQQMMAGLLGTSKEMRHWILGYK